MIPTSHHPSNTSNHRVVNCTWAICLLLPLVIVADSSCNPAIFHCMDFIMGWLAWTYTEYFFNRFIMHGGNQSKGLGKWLNHTHNHVDPHDIRVNTLHRTLMVAGCIIMILVSVLANNHTTLFCGYFIGFTVYSFMHVLLHQQWSKKLFPALHRFHIMHHCKHSDKCFGVVFTWWDHLFGTVPSKNTEISIRIKDFYYKRTKPARGRDDIRTICNN